MRRLACAVWFLVLASGAWGANTASLGVTPAAPTDASTDVQLTFSGNADADFDYADVILVPAGTSCPADPEHPDGQFQYLIGHAGINNGPYDVATEPQSYAAGQYTVCASLDTGDPTQILATATAALTIAPADTLALSATPAAQVSEGIQVGVNATGATYDGGPRLVTRQVPAGQPCDSPAASLLSDLGAFVDFDAKTYTGDVLDPQPFDAGAFTLCSELLPNGNSWSTAPLASGSLPITVVAVSPQVSVTAPAAANTLQGFKVSIAVSNVADGVPVIVDGTITAGSSCPARPSLDDAVLQASVTGGASQTITKPAAEGTAGDYVLCGYVVKNWDGGVPDRVLAGPQAAPFHVAAPANYEGAIRHKGIMGFSVAAGRVIDMQVHPQVRCTHKHRKPFIGIAEIGVPDFPLGPNGSINLRKTAQHVHFRIAGHVAPKRATGTFNIHYVSTAQYRCRTGTQRFRIPRVKSF